MPAEGHEGVYPARSMRTIHANETSVSVEGFRFSLGFKLLQRSKCRVPKSEVLRQLEEGSARKWQTSWTQTNKGSTTKEYFPDIQGRVKMKLRHTGNLTTILTGHGNTDST